MEKLWYVVNTYSGHEYKVKEKLESKIESMGLQDNIFRIVIPETTEVEVKDGVVNRIGISSIPKPKTNFKGGSVKWFDDRKLIRGGDVAY